MKIIIIIIIIIILSCTLKCGLFSDIKKEPFIVPVEALTKYNDLESNLNLFKRVHMILRNNNIENWIICGTLLGAMRSKTMVPWDDDIDIAIMDNNVNILLELEGQLKDNNLGLVKSFFGYKIYELNGKNIDNVNFKYPFIDIFVCIKNNNNVIYKEKSARDSWPKEIYNYNDLFPLKEYIFEDMIVMGPNNPLPFLDTVYPKWRTVGIKPAFDHITHTNMKEYKFDLVNYTKPYIWLQSNNNNIDKKYIDNFHIVVINDNNIKEWIPELDNDIQYKDITNMEIYKIMLLYKYGGIYINSNEIELNLLNMIDILKTYDFIYSTKLLASRSNTRLMGLVLQKIVTNYRSQQGINLYPTINEVIKELETSDNYKYFTL